MSKKIINFNLTEEEMFRRKLTEEERSELINKLQKELINLNEGREMSLTIDNILTEAKRST